MYFKFSQLKYIACDSDEALTWTLPSLTSPVAVLDMEPHSRVY